MIDLPKLNDSASAKDIVDAHNDLIDHFNFLSKKISFKDNFDGQIIENVKFPAGAEVVIPHKLGIKPKHRLILNQVGNGVLSDIPSDWNQFSIKIKNNGAVDIIATIFVIKE